MAVVHQRGLLHLGLTSANVLLSAPDGVDAIEASDPNHRFAGKRGVVAQAKHIYKTHIPTSIHFHTTSSH